ncbi:ADP-ribosylation factor-like protein 13B, partial [Arapaima gigas]
CFAYELLSIVHYDHFCPFYVLKLLLLLLFMYYYYYSRRKCESVVCRACPKSTNLMIPEQNPAQRMGGDGWMDMGGDGWRWMEM